jgi:prevent-host-death family protein
MTVLNATEARANLYSLIDETANTDQPIVITG